uniref:Protein kinase domain-containing protein n=1 Tax=Macrostomum lignano TaxID=282301 RepID=A0A1I8JQH3_9PLAT
GAACSWTSTRSWAKIGEGAYGVVFKCSSDSPASWLPIKKFTESEEDPLIHKIAMREIRMLKYSQEAVATMARASLCAALLTAQQLKHDNLVNLLEVFKRKKRLHLVFQYIDHTLLNEMEAKPYGMDRGQIRKITYQLLDAISFCHSHNCIHRDVKPRIFLSRAGHQTGPGDEYTQTTWPPGGTAPRAAGRRHPVRTACGRLAIGCVFAEMLKGIPLWPGRSDLDQLYLIIKT